MREIEFGTPNTLCPYLVKPLEQVFPINAEHVLPFALGAPGSFTVAASQSENTRLNDLIDAPMINDPLVRFLSTLAQIKTRSGMKSAVMHGTTKFGDDFKVDVTKHVVTPKFKSPIIKNQSGQVIGVKGFGDGVFEEVERLLDGMRSKGKAVPPGPMIMVENSSPLEFSMITDLILIEREAMKTAYLFSVKVLGDQAIESESGEIFRAAFEANTVKECSDSGIRSMIMPPDHYEDIGMAIKHHLLCIKLDDEWMTTQVVLFGRLIYVFWTPRGCIKHENFFRAEFIDAANACFVERPGE